MSGKRIEFFKHALGEAEKTALSAALDSLFLTTGPRVAEWESALAHYLDIPHAVGTASCSTALMLVLRALGIGPGDEVITAPLTFVATALAIEEVGARPVFADVDPDTGLLTVDSCKAAHSARTKAVIPIHLYGVMADVPAIVGWAKPLDLAVIEDAAHCLEGRRNGIAPGQLSDGAAFSFYATKNITCGEGGSFVTARDDLAAGLRVLRNYGLTSSAADRSDGFHELDVVTPGIKGNLTDLQAALLLTQLDRIETLWQKRDALWRRYREGLAGCPALRLPVEPDDIVHARHLFTLRVPQPLRQPLMRRLEDAGIGVSVHFRPLHLFTHFKRTYNCSRGDFPQAECIGDETLTLPLYPNLTHDECDRVIETVRTTMEELAG